MGALPHAAGEQNDQESIVGRILRRAYFDSPPSRLAGLQPSLRINCRVFRFHRSSCHRRKLEAVAADGVTAALGNNTLPVNVPPPRPGRS